MVDQSLKIQKQACFVHIYHAKSLIQLESQKRTFNYHFVSTSFCTSGETVKQADVILLGFPLMVDMPKQVRNNQCYSLSEYDTENHTEKPE